MPWQPSAPGPGTGSTARKLPWCKILHEITGQPWIALVFSIGAVLAIASIVLTVLYGQTRIMLSMSRDGMVPKVFGRVSRRTGTPVAGTLIIGIAVALTAGLVPLGALADATSIGTLFAFALVNVAVIYLRRNRPELERSFRVPLYPITPILGTLMCAYLMVNLGRRHLDHLRHLDAGGPRHLLRLWPPELQGGRAQRAGLP